MKKIRITPFQSIKWIDKALASNFIEFFNEIRFKQSRRLGFLWDCWRIHIILQNMKLLAFLYQNYINYELRLFLDPFRDHPSETEGVLLKKEFPLKLKKKNYSQRY